MTDIGEVMSQETIGSIPIKTTIEILNVIFQKCSLTFIIHFGECKNIGSLLSWALPENKLGNKCKSGKGNHPSGD